VRLGITIDITHPVRLFPQPTNMTCWSAAAAMVIGNMSIGPGSANLSPTGGLLPGPDNVRKFAESLGWRIHYPQTWPVGGLAGLLRHKPAWAVGGGSSPAGNWLHAIVLSAMWSDGAADGSGTMIRIHDPWPPNVGGVYGRFYRGTVDGFDFTSLYTLQPN
jgi:Papain-like cysteine protease AvrRpt2